MLAHLRLRLQSILHIRFTKCLDTALLIAPLGPGQERGPERILQQHPPPPARPLVDGRAQLGHVRGVRVPEAAANEARPGLAVDVVAGVGALPPRAREGDAKMRLVGGRVLAEADVAVDAEDDVLEWKLWDRGVRGDYLLH